MNVHYKTEFRDINNDLIRVELLKDVTAATVKELVAGGDPINLNNNSDDYLYTPMRLFGGTFTVVLDKYDFGLFASNDREIQIKIYRNDSLFYTGFLTPSVYSQNYLDGYNFELQLEFVSALSALQSVEFVKNNDTTITLLQLIKDAISYTKNSYNNIYIPSTFSVKLNEISVSQDNFFDEENKPMTYYEIIEEIAKIFGWYVTDLNNNIYFVDVDYLGNCLQYNNTLSSYSSANLTQTIQENAIPNADNNTKLSLLESYNKINVIASDYEADSDKLYPELSSLAIKNSTSYVEKVIDKKMYKKYWCYTPTEFILHRYKQTNGVWTEINLDDDITNKYGGAYTVKSTEYEIDPLPNRLDYTDSFWINQTYNDDDSHLMYHESSNLKLIEITDNSTSNIIINSDYKLCLNWEAAVIVNNDGLMYPDGDINDLFDNVSGTPQFSFIFSLQIGNYYYNGSTWTTNFSTFEVNCEAGGDFISSYVEAENTGNFLYGVDLEGYLINIDRVLIGNPKLTVYNANAYYLEDMLGINFSKANPRSFMLKNITLEAQKIDRTLEREKKDTLYTNVNDSDNVKELDDVECKLTTKNDSELSFSKLIYNGDFLDKCSNNINNSSQKLEELLVERNIEQYSNFKLKIEQNFSNSLINPNAIMHNNYLNKDFYVISQNYDLKQNNNQLTLISKG